MNSHILLLFTIFLTTTPLTTLSFSFSFTPYQTLFSTSHSLISRVANLRHSRGDFSGSERARAIAKTLERGTGFGFWRFVLSMGWDYFRNYAWTDTFELAGALSEMNELMKGLNELTRLDRSEERMAWVHTNYSKVLRNAKSLFGRLLKMFRQSGPLREAIETLQKEVVEGGLLRDCLVLGGNDLRGLVQVLRDIALQSSSATGRTEL